MCNCKTDVEKKMTETFREQSPEAHGHKAELTGYVLLIEGNTLKSKGAMNIDMTATYPLKKGGEKVRTLKSNMLFTFCPFCGQKYDGTSPPTLTPSQSLSVQRLITAAASVAALSDSGALGEGYDGAEPQRTAAVAALDELAEANHAAMNVLTEIVCSIGVVPTLGPDQNAVCEIPADQEN